MRLKQIKLAGFKSFVDLTKVLFPHQMTAIVGPNGCGKSNLIDAVRWVLGESSAKNLRGDAMTDVIFNGASQRKAIGQASVELIFEQAKQVAEYAHHSLPPIHTNSAAKLAERNEISVRRQVNREGHNQYFLNGSKCRRRDITDIFLGTGLGPRSYAIIEQGTISRLIESKPQELRVFIEEAAGISQYKERRRETELKIKHTNENLSRLNDIRFEVEQQLEKLHIQAEAATRYKELKVAERKLKSELLAMQWQKYQLSLMEFREAIIDERQQVTSLAQIISQQETDKFKFKQEYDHFQVLNTQLQTEKIRLNKQFVVVEQKLKYSRSQAIKTNTTKANIEHKMLAFNTEFDQLSKDSQQLAAKISVESERLAELDNIQVLDRDALNNKQQHYNDVNVRWIKASQAREQQEQERKFILDKQMSLKHEQERVEKQLARIIEQDASFKDKEQAPKYRQALMSLIGDIEQQVDIQKNSLNKLAKIKSTLHQKEQQIAQRQNELAFINTTKEQLKSELTHKKNWQLIQEKWLSQHNVKSSPYIEHITVEDKWQQAVSTLLSDLFSGVVINKLSSKQLSQLSLEQTLLIDESALQKTSILGTIAEKITSDIGTFPWLNTVYVADSLAEAEKLLVKLEIHQSVICPDGTWLCHGVIRRGQDNHEQQFLQKKKRYEALEQQYKSVHKQISALKEEHVTCQLAFDQETMDQKKIVLQLTALNNEKAEIEHQMVAERHKLKWQADQLTQTNTAKKEYSDRAGEISKELTQVSATLSVLDKSYSKDTELEKLRQLHVQLNHEISHFQSNIETTQHKYHNLALSVEQLKMQQIQVMQSIQHTKANIELLNEQKLHLVTDEIEPEILLEMEKELQQLEAHLKSVSDDINCYQVKSVELSKQLTEVDRFIHEQKIVIDKKKEQINQAKINVENYLVRCETLTEQLQEQGGDPANIIKNLLPSRTERSVQLELNRVVKLLSTLGAINLTAIDEYQQHISRKNHLDFQYEDLIQAISTLESAIAKIDQESRQKFKTTFDKVNMDLQVLFPKVFGGGSAYLDLTSHDMLETGVTIMARPPGKKNSTIHLLSGGEKALTALSLVFAIFKLNPAPFCMLDEVDAPLDDTNVGRFCNLVREMSQTVQFIYISHNKIAMEMAAHLTGVTMFEPGVSRMVAVDIDEAIAMAEVS